MGAPVHLTYPHSGHQLRLPSSEAVLATPAAQAGWHRRCSLRGPPIIMVKRPQGRPCDDLPSRVDWAFAVVTCVSSERAPAGASRSWSRVTTAPPPPATPSGREDHPHGAVRRLGRPATAESPAVGRRRIPQMCVDALGILERQKRVCQFGGRSSSAGRAERVRSVAPEPQARGRGKLLGASRAE